MNLPGQPTPTWPNTLILVGKPQFLGQFTKQVRLKSTCLRHKCSMMHCMAISCRSHAHHLGSELGRCGCGRQSHDLATAEARLKATEASDSAITEAQQSLSASEALVAQLQQQVTLRPLHLCVNTCEVPLVFEGHHGLQMKPFCSAIDHFFTISLTAASISD